jgi:hypothetical protein
MQSTQEAESSHRKEEMQPMPSMPQADQDSAKPLPVPPSDSSPDPSDENKTKIDNLRTMLENGTISSPE